MWRAAVATLLYLVAASSGAAAQTVTWAIDPAHSTAEFTVRHMLIANVRGEFDGPTGTVAFDPKDVVGTLQVEATIQTKTINTRNSDRDQDLKSDDFFDVAKYPTIVFKSRRAQTTAPGSFTLVGDLTMHGVTKEVTLNVDGPTPEIVDSDGYHRIGASATVTVNRRDYGLQYNELIEGGGAVVSNEVRITLDLEVLRKPQ